MIAWTWPQIASVLFWKLAPRGVVLTRQDLGALPQDRVLIDARFTDRIRLAFVDLEEAQAMRDGLPDVALSTLDGRWQKIAVVLLWKLRKGGITLVESDRAQVPHDRTILAHGHAQGIEFRWMPKSEATRLTAWDREHEQRLIHEAVR